MQLKKLWRAFLWIIVVILSFKVIDQMPQWIAGILAIVVIVWSLQGKGDSNAA